MESPGSPWPLWPSCQSLFIVATTITSSILCLCLPQGKERGSSSAAETQVGR
jgi:hypothetical protein